MTELAALIRARPDFAPGRRWALSTLAAGLGSMALPSLLSAQTLDKDKVVRLVNAFPAGAGLDPLARQLADLMRGKYGSNIIVENKTGAGGRLAVESVKSALPDGATVLFIPASPVVIYPHLYKKLNYDAFRDLIPVTTLMTIKLGIVVGAGVPAKSLKEYLDWIKKDPKNGSYGSGGLGSMPHFLGASLSRESGVAMTHVPYRGAAAMWQDLLGGQIPMMVGPIGADSLNRHQSGQARILAIAEPSRIRPLPDVPTFAELGFPSLVMQEWWGFFVPAKTPSGLVASLGAAISVAAREPEMQKSIDRFLSEPETMTSADMARRMQAESDKWRGIVQATGFTPDD